jgi:hypothetical protein
MHSATGCWPLRRRRLVCVCVCVCVCVSIHNSKTHAGTRHARDSPPRSHDELDPLSTRQDKSTTIARCQVRETSGQDRTRCGRERCSTAELGALFCVPPWWRRLVRDTSSDFARLWTVKRLQRLLSWIVTLTLIACRAVHLRVNTMHRAKLPRCPALAVPVDSPSLFATCLAPYAADALRFSHLHVARLDLSAASWASKQSGGVSANGGCAWS